MGWWHQAVPGISLVPLRDANVEAEKVTFGLACMVENPVAALLCAVVDGRRRRALTSNCTKLVVA